MRLVVTTLLLLLGPFVTPASAQTAEERVACEADTKIFCPGILPGGGRILDCLAKQKDKLTDSCKKVIASHGK
ncbi:MAG: cysteine rich repeat-containing protein [Xanthobacteraceae bacterium]